MAARVRALAHLEVEAMASVLSLVLLVFLGLGGAVLRQLAKAGLFTRIEPHFAGSCRVVKGAFGPEDITIRPRSGIALVSASDRRADMAGHPVPGGIFEYDFGAAEPRLVNLTPEADANFQPHGISLWSGDDGRDVLFVVNHPPKGSGLPQSASRLRGARVSFPRASALQGPHRYSAGEAKTLLESPTDG